MSARRHIAPGAAALRHRSRILPALSLAVAAVLMLSANAQAVEFQTSPATARVDQSVAFTADPIGAVGASLSWAFGDGAAGTGASVAHAYATAGTYAVTLTATPLIGEPSTTSQTVTVVGDPVAAFSSSPGAAVTGAAIAFDASASSDPGGAIASYAWSFGDGGTGSGQKASHAYATGGDKTVTLTITAGLDGRTASVSHTVHVNVPPVASFSYAPVGAPDEQDPLTPLVGQPVQFSATGSSDPDGTITQWAWDFGSGTFSVTTTVPTVVTTFATAGPKDIRLRVTDGQGATTTAKARLRVNTPPTAGFTISPAAPLTGQTVKFTSTASDPDGAADLAAITWDLDGDGTYAEATGATATAVFLTAGTYKIGEKVTDKGGAARILVKTLSVAGPAAPPPAGGSPSVVVPSPGAPALREPPSLDGGVPTADAPAAIASGAGSVAAVAAAAPRALRGVRVQLTGSVTASRTRISRIVVVAPQGAMVAVRCSGKGCPAQRVRKRVTSSGRLRVAVLERTLWSGARIVVSVAKPGFTTRSIVLKMRRGRAPARSDGCLVPVAGGATKVGRCPTQ
ncbi:MAG TPA: PKD domain-containing protein [Baekduia sp.]|nr:PKD domain-containing protein [Baekduia sp.]